MLPYSLTVSLAFASLVFATPHTLSGRDNTTAEVGLLSNQPDLGSYAQAYEKAKTFVSSLTDAEKISLITGSGVDSVNFTALAFKDGTEGVQQYNYVSAFPDASAMAMTWDKDAIYKQCKATGQEFYLNGFNVISGPVSSPLGRTAWGGRLVESLGADSYLSGIVQEQGTTGFQDAGIVVSARHFLLNEQETNRSASGGGMGSSSSSDSGAPYSSNADDKTLHEAYLWPFYDAVKAGAGAIMCAMNKVNGTLSCENTSLLQKLLKTELGFPGMVFPDVNGQSTAFGSANGGLDYGSSSIWSNTTILAGIANGTLTEARLEDMAIRNVIGYYKVGLDNGQQPAQASAGDKVISKEMRAQNSAFIRKQGANSMVLLKNTNNALPLSDPGIMTIFGAHAGAVMGGPNAAFSVSGSGPVFQGHLGTGTGSAAASMQYLITPQMSLTMRTAEDGNMIHWILNDTYTSTSSGGFGGGGGMGGGAPTDGGNSTTTPGGGASSNSTDASGGNSQAAINAQVQTGTGISPSIDGYAETSETCIVFLNALAGEGADRTELTNADQDALVTQVTSNCNNTIVVVNAVGPRLMDAWIENDNVTAVLYGSLLGQQSGNSIMDVLYGEVNPNGKLVYTIAKNESDYNVEICETSECDFTEGVYIDYKYFDAKNVTPRYEFGYGLSYTTFEYGTNITIATKTIASGPATGVLSVGGRKDLWDVLVNVSVPISNSGSVDGAEVAQLYLGFPAAADQPIRQLRGFDKLALNKGERGMASFGLKRRDLSFWDTAAQEWSVAEGEYTIWIGSSSRDLRVKGTFTV